MQLRIFLQVSSFFPFSSFLSFLENKKHEKREHRKILSTSFFPLDFGRAIKWGSPSVTSALLLLLRLFFFLLSFFFFFFLCVRILDPPPGPVACPLGWSHLIHVSKRICRKKNKRKMKTKPWILHNFKYVLFAFLFFLFETKNIKN